MVICVYNVSMFCFGVAMLSFAVFFCRKDLLKFSHLLESTFMLGFAKIVKVSRFVLKCRSFGDGYCWGQ